MMIIKFKTNSNTISLKLSSFLPHNISTNPQKPREELGAAAQGSLKLDYFRGWKLNSASEKNDN